MTKHFFPEEAVDGDLNDDQKGRLKAVFSEESAALRRRKTASGGTSSSSRGGGTGGQLTPAAVEQLLGEHDRVDDFLRALEGLAG